MSDSRPIGVFDSGVGGLTVVRKLAEEFPRESFLYLGDTARVPYGNKSPRTVERYSLGCQQFLLVARRQARRSPATRPRRTRCRRSTSASPVPVDRRGRARRARRARAATEHGGYRRDRHAGTVRSGAYARRSRRAIPARGRSSRACPLFVPLAEEGWIDDDIAELVAPRYLAAVRDGSADRHARARLHALPAAEGDDRGDAARCRARRLGGGRLRGGRRAVDAGTSKRGRFGIPCLRDRQRGKVSARRGEVSRPSPRPSRARGDHRLSGSRIDGRGPADLRPISIETGVSRYAEGSALITQGETKVLCTASIEDRVPPFLKNSGTGWVTAEYGMLPRSTHTRSAREAARGKQGRPYPGDPASHRPGPAKRRRPEGFWREDLHSGLRRPSGGRRHAVRGDQRGLRRAGARVRESRGKPLLPELADARNARRGLRRARQRNGAARPLLRGGLHGPGRFQHRRHGIRQVRGSPDDGGAGTFLQAGARRDALSLREASKTSSTPSGASSGRSSRP